MKYIKENWHATYNAIRKVWQVWPKGTGMGRICTITNRDEKDEEAIAILIAAAPDLLSVCEKLLSLMKDEDFSHIWLNAPSKPEVTPKTLLEDVIAKAEPGETTCPRCNGLGRVTCNEPVTPCNDANVLTAICGECSGKGKIAK